tara:strand:- start:74 stop:502 length:429 start_codon:yes stop_codon:yes gene_type:complete
MVGISLNDARTIIIATAKKGQEMGMKPLSTIVLDAGGHVIAFERQDGAAPGRFAIAQGKAYGTVMLGMPGSAQMARAEQQAYFMAAVNGVYGGKVIPVPGGVLVRDSNGEVVGSVGVTGDTSDNDLIAALTGINAAGFVGDG